MKALIYSFMHRKAAAPNKQIGKILLRRTSPICHPLTAIPFVTQEKLTSKANVRIDILERITKL